MSRYIEQDFIGSAVSNLPTTILQTEHSIELVVPVTDVIKIIKNAPSIDIVRCQECIHCADDWNGNQPMFTCELGRCGESVQPSDFCSYGEREGE